MYGGSCYAGESFAGDDTELEAAVIVVVPATQLVFTVPKPSS